MIPFNRAEANLQIAEMKTSINVNYMRLFFWYFNKNLRVKI